MNLFTGNLEEEEKVLKWLQHQQSNDQIEDVTDEMLDMIISKMPHVAALFCEYYFIIYKAIKVKFYIRFIDHLGNIW